MAGVSYPRGEARGVVDVYMRVYLHVHMCICVHVCRCVACARVCEKVSGSGVGGKRRRGNNIFYESQGWP